MIKKPDIVSLKWVIDLMKSQADSAEAALVEYGSDPTQKQALLRCMWSVHQITSTLKALGMSRAEMLTLEMERTLNYLYKDKIAGERRKLAMGGLMQGLKVMPAYLDHAEAVRVDTGRGLERYVNDLRRWVGEKPRPKAFFFHMNIDPEAGISSEGLRASDDEIRSRANVMLALYLEMAKQALRKRKVSESMVTVARISRKMQTLFTATGPERFWFAMIGLCEGIAGGLIEPDECIAQIFKAGAFSIKYARENGGSVDPNIDYDAYLQQMLYYIAACKSRPVHISGIRSVFGIDDNTLSDATRGLVHNDALVSAISGALEQLNIVVEFLCKNDLVQVARQTAGERDNSALEAVEAAEHRLIAAGQMAHVDSLKKVQRKLRPFYNGAAGTDLTGVNAAVGEITRGIVEVKQDLEHKLEHGLGSSFSGKDFELRESVATATFKQMSLVENYLQQMLRRKALKSALDKKPLDFPSTLRLTTALQRHLNKTDIGHEELRQAIRDADNGDPDLDLLYGLAIDYLNHLDTIPDRKAIARSLQLLEEISGALHFSGMQAEGAVIDQCHKWLSAASDAGSVREDDAFRCFADAFAQLEMHLQRSLIDPQDDTSHVMALATQRAEELVQWTDALSPGRSTGAATEPVLVGPLAEAGLVEDDEILPEFREVFIEESEEIVAELGELTEAWLKKPEINEMLRDIRRHFHTFKGNGRAVGANVLGELGWAAQDMLDRSLDGDLHPGENVQALVNEVVDALPSLVASYSKSGGPDLARVRELTDACFAMASSGGADLAERLPHVSENIATAEQVSSSETLTH